MQDRRENWRVLCSMAREEKDPARLSEIIGKLVEEIRRKEKMLAAKLAELRNQEEQEQLHKKKLLQKKRFKKKLVRRRRFKAAADAD